MIYGDLANITMLYSDNLSGKGLEGATASFHVIGTDVEGAFNSKGGGVYEAVVDSTLLTPGSYSMEVSAFKNNYTLGEAIVTFTINPLPLEIRGSDVLSVRWTDLLNVSVIVWDTHNNVSIADATVTYTFKNNMTGEVIYTGTLSSAGNGTYSLQLPTGFQNTTPGMYILIIEAERENSTTAVRKITVNILPIATMSSSPNMYASEITSPAVLAIGPYIQAENNVPFIVIFFTYVDSNGNPVPNATVTANGIIPLTPIGEGKYALIIPTSGLPPSNFLIEIKGEAENYETSRTYNVLTIKEWSIPLGSIRVPASMLFAILLAVIAPSATFTAYTYIRKMKYHQ
nr:hypothetical protein [Candidatus Freyrarchaeum guaymaensis]